MISVSEPRIDDTGADECYHVTSITLDVGRLSGILPGMEFQPSKPLPWSGKLVVAAVERDTRTATLRQRLSDSYDPVVPEIGRMMTTGPR